MGRVSSLAIAGSYRRQTSQPRTAPKTRQPKKPGRILFDRAFPETPPRASEVSSFISRQSITRRLRATLALAKHTPPLATFLCSKTRPITPAAGLKRRAPLSLVEFPVAIGIKLRNQLRTPGLKTLTHRSAGFPTLLATQLPVPILIKTLDGFASHTLAQLRPACRTGLLPTLTHTNLCLRHATHQKPKQPTKHKSHHLDTSQKSRS